MEKRPGTVMVAIMLFGFAAFVGAVLVIKWIFF